MGIDEKHLRFRDYRAIGYKEGFVWILKTKNESCVGIYETRHMMTSSSTMKLIPVAPFAMNWYKFGKKEAATGINVSADIWIIPLETSKGKCVYL